MSNHKCRVRFPRRFCSCAREVLGFGSRRLPPTLSVVSRKNAKIAALIEGCRGQELDAHYLGYFECFNRGLFYEAHDVLEVLWLANRQGPNGAFYKGLIQMAGAFVHLQKGRLQPAGALFRLSRANLLAFPALHEQLDVSQALAMIEDWQTRLERTNYSANPLTAETSPRLTLRSD